MGFGKARKEAQSEKLCACSYAGERFVKSLGMRRRRMNHQKTLLYPLTGMLIVLTLLMSACGGGNVTATEPPAPEATSAATEEPVATSAPTESPVTEEAGELSVLDWAGYDAEDFWVDFKNAYPDVTDNFEIGISDADIYAKMAAGN